ncbi:MAG: hypothetical protein IPJ19_09705 [Planctomycetes bacterium]|nr:hypothetical protein [Planctomycetota bacterium]
MKLPLLLALSLCAASPARQDPVWKSWKEVPSNAGRYHVRYQIEPDPPPRGELFSLHAYVLDEHSRPIARKLDLLVDADMPEHGHGLTRLPAVAPGSEGGFEVSGLRLHMPGKWQLYLDIVEGAHTERAQFDLVLE